MNAIPAREKKNNGGYTLVELITVISIMMVISGVAVLSINTIFSQDAKKTAITIDDALSEIRMLSMSKSGDFVMTVQPDPSDSKKHTIIITRGGNPYKTIDVDRSVLITLNKGETELVGSGGDIVVTFDKSTGKVTNIGATETAGAAADSLYEIRIVAQNGSSKTATVFIVANTGRHYTDK